MTAVYNLGVIYANNGDSAKAKSLYKEASDNDDTSASIALGNLYHREENFEESLKYYKKVLHNSTAQYKYAQQYHLGQGVEKNLDVAYFWYKQSALEENVDAQYEVAWMLYEGKGIDKNRDEAKVWMTKLADQGYDYAIKDLEKWA